MGQPYFEEIDLIITTLIKYISLSIIKNMKIRRLVTEKSMSVRRDQNGKKKKIKF